MMNIETLLQAAQILENQQSVPPKKRLARGEYDSLRLVFSSLSASIEEDLCVCVERMNHARGEQSMDVNTRRSSMRERGENEEQIKRLSSKRLTLGEDIFILPTNHLSFPHSSLYFVFVNSDAMIASDIDVSSSFFLLLFTFSSSASS